MKAVKAAKVVRRRPRQARSQSTVDAIYEGVELEPAPPMPER